VPFKEISECNLAIAGEVVKIAREIGRSSAQVALNWSRRQPGVIPILGARTHTQIQDNLSCLEFTLTKEQVERLDKISRIEMGFPHDFFQTEAVRGFAYGGMFEQIDNHRRTGST